MSTELADTDISRAAGSGLGSLGTSMLARYFGGLVFVEETHAARLLAVPTAGR